MTREIIVQILESEGAKGGGTSSFSIREDREEEPPQVLVRAQASDGEDAPEHESRVRGHDDRREALQ